ncbi:MAG: LD-carboxypeptidase [Candidatus Aminicenantes bacterium]|nr:LD-carboxypeptidase [Candidatus Aminicenantes bacterium]
MSNKEDRTGKSLFFMAPSTQLGEDDRPRLRDAVGLISGALETNRVNLSPYLFTSDRIIGHVTAPIGERAGEFKAAVREGDVIVSVAGGTGAEDLVPMLDRTDYRVIRKRKPLFIGFSDFTFLLNEVYSRCGVPGILFPSLRLNEGNMGSLLSLIKGEEIGYRGSAWLSDPPDEAVSGIPIGGNLTTFVNFLNREKPPRLCWRELVLFIEDIGIDLEDLHRLVAALRRHRVFRSIKGLVIGSLAEDLSAPQGREFQDKAVSFLLAYLSGVLKKRRDRQAALPIMLLRTFGHNITAGLPAVPIGGLVTLSPSLEIAFRLR